MASKTIPLIVMSTDSLRAQVQHASNGSVLKEYDGVLSELEENTARPSQDPVAASSISQKAPAVPIPRHHGVISPPEDSHSTRESYLDTTGHEQPRKRKLHSTDASLPRNGNGRRRPLWPAGPVDVLGATSKDPFQSSPLGSDGHVHEMIHLYLNAHLILALQSSSTKPVRNRMVSIRKHSVFPTVVSSPAACSALRKC